MPTVWFQPQLGPQSQARGRFWRRLRLFLFLAVTLLLLAASAAAGLGLALWIHSDLIVPGVQVMGVDVGGRHRAAAARNLEDAWSRQTIILEAGDNALTVAPGSLGMRLNTVSTLQQAHQQGRTLDNLEAWLKNGGHVSLRPVWEFDPTVAEAYLLALAPQMKVPAVDASLAIVDGIAKATPPAAGQELDVEGTMAGLAQDPTQVLAAERMALVIVPVEPAVTDMSNAAVAANKLLATSFTIHGFDPVTGEIIDTVVTPNDWQPWLALDIRDIADGQFSWTVNESQLQSFLAEVATTYGSERHLDVEQLTETVKTAIDDQTTDVYARIYHSDRRHTVKSGETLASIGRNYGIPYPWIQHANPNLGDELFAGQTITIPSPDTLLPLPIVHNKRIVVSIAQQRVWVYENGEVLWEWLASTGIEDSPTAPGIFQIQSHQPNAYASIWDLWMPNFMGVYRPVPTSDFMNGFHGFPTRQGANLLWTGDLGRKVTFGCILLSSENAATLYEWAEEGVVVEILP